MTTENHEVGTASDALKAEKMRHERLIEQKSQQREFWIGQMLVILSTIMGVYLAAHEGFKVAIDFEMVRSDIDSYYLRKSMRDELKDNIQNIKEFAHYYRNSERTYNEKKDHVNKPALSLYVWQAMQYNPETTEIPSHILTAVRRYYTKSAQLLENVGRGSIVIASEKLLEETLLIESETLQIIDDDLVALQESIKKYNVDLDL